MTIYTNVTKPAGTIYTNQNSVGKIQYDQVDILYDDTGTFYDGVNEGLYTNVTKPAPGGYGNYTWAALSISWGAVTGEWSFTGTPYQNVPKPL